MNKECYAPISDEEIEMVEKILLSDGEKFDEEERRKIIRCMDKSIDVVACPGSGKTTTLLAKLIILANRMPFYDGKGICVLTHTNVAINEIKNRIGSKSDVLFKYPNYFGTIHGFVDKFLAIPYYKKAFKKNVIVIDDKTYYKEVAKQYIYLKKEAKAFCRKNSKKFYPYNIKFSDLAIENNQCRLLNLDLCNAEDKTIYKSIFQMKMMILKRGILSYSDIFMLGNECIKKIPELKNYFNYRFKYVFMDEVQDTKKYQQKLLDKVFDNEKIIIQKFGDPNQGIFDGNGNDECGWDINESINITSSKRYGENYAKYICSLRKVRIEKLKGNTNIATYPPHLLIYDDECIENVGEKFIEIIKRYRLNDSKYKHPIKAVGWVGDKDEKEKASIKRYFPHYIKQKKNTNDTYNFKLMISKSENKENSIYKIYNIVLDFIVVFLHKIEIKDKNDRYFSKTEFVKFLKENYEETYNELRVVMIEWTRKIINNNSEVYNEINNYLKTRLIKVFNESSEDIQKIDEFFCDEEVISDKENGSSKNCYIKDEIEVHIDTIHNVKGETHTATLYLETFYKKHDLGRIIEFLLGRYDEKKVKGDMERSLKMAYVGMSRATKLVCLAIHKDRVMEYIEEFEEYGYKLEGCNKNICNELGKIKKRIIEYV